MRISMRAIWMVVPSFVLLVATIFSASAAPNDAQNGILEGEDVIRRPVGNLDKWSNSRMEIIQGERTDEGSCRHRVEFLALAGDTNVQAARLMAVDPTTCRFQVEFGTPDKVPAFEDDGESSSAHGEDAPNAAVLAANRLTTFTVAWYEPLGLKVNHVRNAVNTQYSGDTVTWVGCKDHRWWLSATGWGQAANWLNCDNLGYAGDSSTYARFKNGVFCAGMDTNVYYSLNHAYASPWPSSGWIDNTWASGTCAGLLYWNAYFEPGVYY